MSKTKGSNAERELLHMFWSKNWATIRSAGSGSMKYPGPDLLVGNLFRRMAIECKATKASRQYVSQEQIQNLQHFSKVFGAEPYVGVRFDKDTWYFLSLDDIERTDGENYVISTDLAKKKGLLFEELIQQI